MTLRLRLIIITAMALLTLAVWTVPEWWILANPESPVAQGLPGLSMEARIRFDALSDQEQADYFAIYEGDEDTERAPQPDWALALVRGRFEGDDQPTPVAAARADIPENAILVASGEWFALDSVRLAEGDVMIYRLADGRRILQFDDNFRTVHAPDIHIILTRNPDPLDTQGVGVDYIDIGSLEAVIGSQRYTVPESADFSRYPVMVLYSVQYQQIIATLTIR